jgi:hypothetical protein
MTAVSPRDTSIEVASIKTLGARWAAWMFAPPAIAALVVGDELHLALIAAGYKVERLPWYMPKDRVEHNIALHFAKYDATVDANHFPVFVIVTLHDLGRDACLDARRVAHRIEGRVVITVDRRTVAESCRDDTTMTRRILP